MSANSEISDLLGGSLLDFEDSIRVFYCWGRRIFVGLKLLLVGLYDFLLECKVIIDEGHLLWHYHIYMIRHL